MTGGSRSGGQTAAAGYAVRRGPERSWRTILWRSAVLAAVLGLLSWAVFWLLTSPTFGVARVESGSYRFTVQAELDSVLSTFLGRNIWSLSNGEVAAAVTPLPWVRDLRVLRRLPAMIEVDFREWRPLLEVDGAGGSATGPFVLIGDGRVLPFPDHLALAGLPVLVGVPCRRDSVRSSLVLAEPYSGQVMDLLTAIDEAGLESLRPVDFVVAGQDGFAIVLQEGLGTLLVGEKEFGQRLERYMTAVDHLERGLEVDLRFADRVTCRQSEGRLPRPAR